MAPAGPPCLPALAGPEGEPSWSSSFSACPDSASGRRTWKVDSCLPVPLRQLQAGAQSLAEGLREEHAGVGLPWATEGLGLPAAESRPRQPGRQAWGAALVGPQAFTEQLCSRGPCQPNGSGAERKHFPAVPACSLPAAFLLASVCRPNSTPEAGGRSSSACGM